MMRFPALCALTALASPATAATDPLPPKASWVVDFADAQCVASRNYGTHEDPLYLVIKSPPIGDVLQVAVVRKGYIPTASQMGANVILGDRPPIQTTALEYGMKKDDETAVMVNLSRAQVALLRGAPSIQLQANNDRPDVAYGSRILQSSAKAAHYSLKLTQIPALLDMLDKCSAGLRKAWHVDIGDAPSSVRRGPTGDLHEYFSDDDYPHAALRKGQSGAITVAILVDEKGKVADCTVIETSGIASLDTQSCAVIRARARLAPATGLDGKPAKGALVQTIRWMLDD